MEGVGGFTVVKMVGAVVGVGVPLTVGYGVGVGGVGVGVAGDGAGARAGIAEGAVGDGEVTVCGGRFWREI